MARLIGPDEASREVRTTDSNGRFQSKATRPATFYIDAAATTLADILSYPGGVSYAGSVVTIDAYSMLPLFQFPDGVDHLYVVVDGGPAWPVYARTDDRIDALEIAVTGLGGAAVLSVGTSAGTVAAGDDSRITGAAQKGSNLSDLADAATARTNLGVFAPDVQTFAVSGTWTNPSPAVARPVRVYGHTAGCGGGSGRRGAAGTVRCGGGGGAAGSPFEIWMSSTELPASVPVTVGVGGVGGAAVTVNDTDGNPGSSSGGLTCFGAASTTYRAGQTNASTGGGRGGTAATGTGGGSNSGGPAGANASATGLAGSAPNTVNLTNGLPLQAASPGGSGGGISTGDATAAGGAGGTIAGYATGGTAGAGGTTGSAGGAGSATPVAGAGGYGGGGGGSGTSGGGAGGAGAGVAGGGGGGGASLNGAASGAGGPGGDGFLIVTTYL